jgi:hypothetical protein
MPCAYGFCVRVTVEAQRVRHDQVDAESDLDCDTDTDYDPEPDADPARPSALLFLLLSSSSLLRLCVKTCLSLFRSYEKAPSSAQAA